MSRYVRLALRVVLFVGAILFFGSRAASAAEAPPPDPVGAVALDASAGVEDAVVSTPQGPVDLDATTGAVADIPAPDLAAPAPELPDPTDPADAGTGAVVVDPNIDLSGG